MIKEKKKNPLYVVTGKGKTVEEANSYIDALVKKLGIEPVFKLIEEFWSLILENITSYVMLENISKWIDEFLCSLQKMLKKIGLQTT